MSISWGKIEKTGARIGHTATRNGITEDGVNVSVEYKSSGVHVKAKNSRLRIRTRYVKTYIPFVDGVRVGWPGFLPGECRTLKQAKEVIEANLNAGCNPR